MISSFSGQDVPTDKLFVLYYPPSMAHQDWTKSVYAAARAREAVEATIDELQSFEKRYVKGPNLAIHLMVGLVGLGLLGYWLWVLATSWSDAGFVSAFVVPFSGLILVLFGRHRWKAYAERRRIWVDTAREAVRSELDAVSKLRSEMPEDPSAEDAAAILRRECPEALSEIAFQGAHFNAFTYLDFVMYPKLKNPVEKGELPDQHSLNRDAYYVGDTVFDSWRTFHRDRREVIDPRFVGSGGKRGVI